MPGPLIQLDPFAELTANRAPSEITVTFTSRQGNETITLIRHARPALAPSIGALTQPVGFSTKRCLLVAAVSSASLLLPRLLPAKIAAVALSAVAMRAYAEDGFTRVAASWTKQDLRHVLDDKPPLRFGDDAESSLSKPARDQKTSFSDAQRHPKNEFEQIIDATYVYQPKGWVECRNQATRLRILTLSMRWSGLPFAML